MALSMTRPPAPPAIPQKEALRDNPHLYECFKTIESWAQLSAKFMADVVARLDKIEAYIASHP
jgi:hypothetical protein